MAIVRVNSGGTGGASASPYTASAGQTVVVDSSTGNVVINLPTLSLGQQVTIAHDPATSLATNSLTVHGPGPDLTLLAQPAPNNQPTSSAFASPIVIGGSTGTWPGVDSDGWSGTWYNGGSSGGYLLQ